MKTKLLLVLLALAALSTQACSEEKTRGQAIARGVAFLGSAQAGDGHFGSGYPVAFTSMAGLAILAGKEDPLHDRALLGAYKWLAAQQKEGSWPQEAHTWVHVQGFATLFFAELYGRALLAKEVPKEIDKEELRATVTKAVALLEQAQARSGGWYYTRTADSDEGSTTVCAVQALRAAKNYGIPVEPHVLDRGFAYLKAMQNEDGGFRYMGAAGGSMGPGTSAAVATLVLMHKLDEKVLLNAIKFLERSTAAARGSCYGVFYSTMAMKVIQDEYGDHMPIAARWTREIEAKLLAGQREDGSWHESELGDSPEYATALAVLSLACEDGKLSILHRKAPKLP